MALTIPLGRNAMLREAWENLYGKPAKASNVKAKPEVAPKKPAKPPAKRAAKKAPVGRKKGRT